jgi:hypothetical protein
MAINKAFDQQHRAMKALYETMERDQTWDSPEQRTAAIMVVHVLWSLARCRKPPAVLLEFLRENMDKLQGE